jgi:hypothetical protein
VCVSAERERRDRVQKNGDILNDGFAFFCNIHEIHDAIESALEPFRLITNDLGGASSEMVQ